MRIKNVKIGIRGLREGLEEFAKVAEAIERGESPKKKRHGVYFENIDTMRKVLTDKRLTLLKAIKEKHPSSIYELAKIVDRDFKNVSDDLKYLAEIGLVELKKSKEDRTRVTPAVGYDKILLEIAV
ncbi:MAG: hypothetical protein AB1480_12515 [Nitrospirota bacterium]